MNIRVSIIALILGIGAEAQAQFGTQWLQDEKYWGDGKAEFDLYDAQLVRYGQARASEVIHIYVREPFSQRELVKAEPGSKAGTYPVLKLNQILHIPTGLYVYQQMHSAFWRTDSGALVKATLTSNDSCGNTYKEFRALAGPASWPGGGWRYEWRTYWEGASAGEENIRAPKDAVFYDELPMRVRSLAASGAGQGLKAISLAPTIISSKKGDVRFSEGEMEYATQPVGMKNGIPLFELTVEVRANGKEDVFIVEKEAPYRLKEWRMNDGGKLTLRRSLKIDYWNYNKPGDKERALALP